MNVILNNPHKPRNKMSRRERYATMIDEVNYTLNLLTEFFKLIESKITDNPKPKIYVTLTTPKKERDVFAFHCNQYLPMVRVVVGRTSVFDDVSESKRRICTISSMQGDWLLYRTTLEDLLESFTVLIDAKTFIELPKGRHGQYCRWTQPLESELTLVIKTISERYGSEQSTGIIQPDSSATV